MPADEPADRSDANALPFGLEARHLAPRSSGRLRTTLILFFIGLPLLAGLSGVLGGGGDTKTRIDTPDATLTITAPDVLRSGNWFEMQVAVEPRRDVDDLSIAIAQPLWRGMSIDTAVPDAESAQSVDGRFTYSFGPIRSGQRFTLKLDGQIQPRGARRLAGTIVALDGEIGLAAAPLAITVLP